MSTPAAPTATCPIARTLEIVGEKWSLLILRDVARGITKFSEIHDSLNCPKNLLSARLKTLVSAGILAKREYKEPGARLRSSYHLTEAGADLLPVLIALQSWGRAHLNPAELISTRIFHRECGGEVHAALTCAHGHHIGAAEIHVEWPELHQGSGSASG